MKRFCFVFVVLALVFASSQPVIAADAARAPILNANSPTAIPGRYIVVLKTSATTNDASQAVQAAINLGATIHFTYDAALVGFAATLSDQALNALRANPNVDYIEADQVISLSADQLNPPSWGLDRIDQRNLPLNSKYTYNYTGTGVTAYIIDTGIWFTHNDFGGRATFGYDSVGDGRNGLDCNGHGTHVAGTVGGTTYGVAKNVSLVAVRVLNCSGSGTTSGVIAGINWVTSQHQASSVANMSLGGSASTSLDTAVKNSISAGVTYAVAAGNDNRKACNYSPARVPTAITVGATTSKDARASYSNYGTCLDLFAPGSNIKSDWYGSNTATNTISGTSMATPHVTGVAALYLQAHPGASPATVASAITSNATPNVVTRPGTGSPNLLLYSIIP